MKRKIYNSLLAWKTQDSRRAALLIDGARRVGKSYIVEEFARNEYKSYILIDFNKVNKDIQRLFDDFLDDLDTFFAYLSAYFNVQLHPRESLIIFDEVQLFPRARAAIKYLVEDGRYDYIETGSLISIKANIADIVIPSEERHIKMYPLDQVTESLITNCFEEGTVASNFAYQQFFTALEQTVEELAKCFLYEFGENKEFSYGRCRKGKSFNDLYEGLNNID